MKIVFFGGFNQFEKNNVTMYPFEWIISGKEFLCPTKRFSLFHNKNFKVSKIQKPFSIPNQIKLG